MNARPTVSVVMATYNRSELLPYSIGSLLRGTVQDWELIVVGDCCTDATDAVVRGFDDPRIRFVNLAANVGEQSGPNNVGVQQARGEFLAFLNHDDLWCPDHLARSLAVLATGDGELVFGQGLAVERDGPGSLVGALCGALQRYEPWMYVPASLWVMKTDLARRVGPWRPASQMSNAPSQDWLHRAHRQQARMLADPAITTVIIASGERRNSYRDGDCAEHALWFGRLGDDAVTRQAVGAVFGAYFLHDHLSIRRSARRLFGTVMRRALLALGIWPPSLRHWVRYGRRGSLVRSLRQIRGLAASGAPPRNRSR